MLLRCIDPGQHRVYGQGNSLRQPCGRNQREHIFQELIFSDSVQKRLHQAKQVNHKETKMVILFRTLCRAISDGIGFNPLFIIKSSIFDTKF